jgi:hypothetical protein
MYYILISSSLAAVHDLSVTCLPDPMGMAIESWRCGVGVGGKVTSHLRDVFASRWWLRTRRTNYLGRDCQLLSIAGASTPL